MLLSSGGLLASLLSDVRSADVGLVVTPSAGPTEHVLADVSPRVPLPPGAARPHAMHALRGTGGAHVCVAVVLQNGGVVWCVPAAGDVAMHTAPLGGHAAAGAAAATNSSSSGSGAVRASATCRDTLAVLTQPAAGAHAHVQLYVCRSGKLSVATSMSVSCPATRAVATRLHLTSTYALVEVGWLCEQAATPYQHICLVEVGWVGCAWTR